MIISSNICFMLSILCLYIQMFLFSQGNDFCYDFFSVKKRKMGICILLLKIKCVWLSMYTLGASQVAQEVKNPPASAGDIKRLGFDPWVGKISWRRKWQLTPVFLPGESHGQRSLAGYSSWGRRELDMTEVTERANIYIQIQFISIAIQNYIIEINYNLFSSFFL